MCDFVIVGSSIMSFLQRDSTFDCLIMALLKDMFPKVSGLPYVLS